MSEEEWNMARGIPVLGLGIDKHSPEQIKKQKQRAKRFIIFYWFNLMTIILDLVLM